MKRNLMLVVFGVALITGACGRQNGAGNLEQAGATADASLATAGAQAGDAAATAAAAAAPAVGTAGAVVGDAASSVEARINERLVARVWQWQETTDSAGASTKPPISPNYTVTFIPGGSVAVKADCKTAGGTFTADDYQMMFTVKVATTEPCPAGSLADTFVEQLGRVDSWAVDGKFLALGLANNAGTMHFVSP